MITHTSSTMANLIDKTFQNLTIRSLEFRPDPHTGYRILHAYCECSCGNFKWLAAIRVTSNSVRSCGCLLTIANRTKKLPSYNGIDGAWFSSLKRDAIRRNIDFFITIEELWLIWEKQGFRCALTGESLTWPYRLSRNEKRVMCYGDASVDRIDSLKGYTFDNIQIIHKYINIMKLDHTQEDFIELCRKVAAFSAENQKKKPVHTGEVKTGRSEIEM